MAWTTPRTWVDGEVETASLMNTHVRDNLSFLFGDTAWQSVSTYFNSWAEYDLTGAYGPVRYRRHMQLTTIQGLVRLGTLAATAFTLPVGYRPSRTLILSSRDAAGATSYNELRIDASGNVIPYVGNNTWFSVAATFVAEQ